MNQIGIKIMGYNLWNHTENQHAGTRLGRIV